MSYSISQTTCPLASKSLTFTYLLIMNNKINNTRNLNNQGQTGKAEILMEVQRWFEFENGHKFWGN